MTNDELAAAIQVASERFDQTTSDHARMWREHLAALLEIQRKKAAEINFTTITADPPPFDRAILRKAWDGPVP
jgi:hypothetical protein